ncbi:diaminopimelate epimerase [Cardinium endosymbiont of Sogatella furcifera]|uniref:diaminopimelate epimerase n=1 Tax=Cardinium endosymbiont of Sogatella furcifera TaxID=650378 RepID=UPI000E0D9169|nr:diaminopimelate epimerase [Cardinium endosymbiont of Sogatella furcifera]AXI23872.1 diaminopimelate epimerase [Cardinium endosymbiont of Sogatella furcifera]
MVSIQLKFAKYQAAGNDFIIINNLEDQHYTYDPIVTQQLCHRQFGIGADGIITIEQKAGCDFSLLHYNADGSQGGGLCGNGSRSAIHYAQQLGIIDQKAHFMAIDGLHTGYIANDLVHLTLQDIAVIQPLENGYFLDNGTRHYVEMVDAIQEVNMQVVGFPRRNMHPFEKEGINLNFVQLVEKDTIVVRTCECGLETEPLSCGTGVVASALVTSAYHGLNSPITVRTKGGKLQVTFRRLSDGCFSHIQLVGRVYQSFHGMVHVTTPLTEWNTL